MNLPLYKTCPKCGYQRPQGDTSPADRCPRCGLYFEKWLKRRFGSPLQRLRKRPRRPSDKAAAPARWLIETQALLLPRVERVNGIVLLARGALWLVLLLWGGWFIMTDHRVLIDGLPPINYSVLHWVDLVFHEAGHVIFTLLGNFMAVLGGSLMQLLIPAVAGWALLFRHHDAFGASVALWWLAQSLMDLAPYIYDARRQGLELLGGGTGRDRPGAHDWNNLLGRMGMLEADHALAWLVDAIGVMLMLAALTWGAMLLRQQLSVYRGQHRDPK